jgi:hypothetical protein
MGPSVSFSGITLETRGESTARQTSEGVIASWADAFCYLIPNPARTGKALGISKLVQFSVLPKARQKRAEYMKVVFE